MEEEPDTKERNTELFERELTQSLTVDLGLAFTACFGSLAWVRSRVVACWSLKTKR